MRVSVVLENRFVRTPDGNVWTGAQFAYSFWRRYLDVFEDVNVVARVRDTSSVPSNWDRCDGEQVHFTRVPYYLGPWEYLWKARQVRYVARKSIDRADSVILRVPGNVSSCVERFLKNDRPYGVEVVADSYDVFAPRAVNHPLRFYFRWRFVRNQRRLCKNACACSYVTEKALQHRYRPADTAFLTHYSSVELPQAAISPMPRPRRDGSDEFRLITVCSLAHLQKGPDLLIDAIAACARVGMNLRLFIVGDGKCRKQLESRVTATHLARSVQFLGQLPAGEAVRAQFDRADLFLLASRQEGLPRAMIEAMARGLPCIGSTVGGIPELLPPEDLVGPGNVEALARKIREIVTDPERMARMSARNLEKAKEYLEEALRPRRIAFYRHLRERTEKWVRSENA